MEVLLRAGYLLRLDLNSGVALGAVVLLNELVHVLVLSVDVVDGNLVHFLAIGIGDILAYQIDQSENIRLLPLSLSISVCSLRTLHILSFIYSIVTFDAAHSYCLDAELSDKFLIFLGTKQRIYAKISILLAKVFIRKPDEKSEVIIIHVHIQFWYAHIELNVIKDHADSLCIQDVLLPVSAVYLKVKQVNVNLIIFLLILDLLINKGLKIVLLDLLDLLVVSLVYQGLGLLQIITFLVVGLVAL